MVEDPAPLFREQRVHVRGDIDLGTREQLADSLDMVIECTGDDVVVDLTEVGFMDSSGIAVLVDARNRLEAQGRGCRLVHVPARTRRVIEILDLIDFLGVES